MAAHTQIRWTIETAAREFGLDKETLAKRLTAGGVLPGADKKFGTADICRAVFGDIEGEKLRLVREQADAQAIKNQVARRELTPTPAVRRHLEAVLVALKAGILASGLMKEEKDDLLNNLRKLGEPVRVDDETEDEIE
jgi:phage terminase Nu1 subunit (DNA packaging protein)